PLAIGVPTFDKTTGDPILPERAAGYSLASAVLVHSDALATLDPAALDALVNWVLGGGTLAVIPNRAEDLRGPVLTALVGSTVTKGQPPEHLFRLFGTTRTPQGTAPPDPFGGDPSDPQAAPPAPTTTPMKWDPGSSPLGPTHALPIVLPSGQI